MATDERNQDPLERLALPFLVALGFVWALAFALLILNLRAGEWRTVDGTALVLLAFMLGIALLPFVSQLSIAGFFQFRRESGQLAGEIQELGVLAGEELARQATDEISSITDVPLLRLIWGEFWQDIRYLIGLYYLQKRARKHGLIALKETDYAGVATRFQRGVDLLVNDEQLNQDWKRNLLNLIEANGLINEGSDDAAQQIERALPDLRSVSSFLHGSFAATVPMDAAALGSLTRDSKSGPTYVAELMRILQEREDADEAKAIEDASERRIEE